MIKRQLILIAKPLGLYPLLHKGYRVCQAVLFSCMFALFCVFYNVSFTDFFAKIIRAQQRGALRFFPLYGIAIPLSDEKSVFNGGVHDSSIVHHLRLKVIVGYKRHQWLRYIRYSLYLLGVGTLKRIGAMTELQCLAQRLSQQTEDVRLRALALDTLGDCKHLLFLWQRAIADEKAINLFGHTGFYIHPAETFFTHAHLREDVALEAEAYYRKALESDPAFGFAHYQLARLARHRGQWLEAIACLQAFVAWVEQEYADHACAVHARYELQALQMLREEGAVTSLQQLSLVEAPSLEASVIRAELLDDQALEARYGNSPGFHAAPAQSLTIDYWYYADGKPAQQMKRRLNWAPVYLLTPAEARIDVNYLPHLLLDGQAMMQSSRIYGRAQFDVFDKHMIRYDDEHALRLITQPSHILNSPAILCQGYADNYYHFLFDCLGTLAFVPETEWERRTLLFGGHSRDFKRYQCELLELCGLEHLPKLKVGNNDRPLVSQQMLVTSNPNRLNVAHPQVVHFLRHRLLGGQEAAPIRGKRIFFYRGERRRIPGESFKKLEVFLLGQGFRIINPETMSVAQQRDLLRDAEILLLEIGGSAANLLFAPRGCQVIMLSCEFGYRDIFTPIASTLGQELRIVFSPNKEIYPKPYLAWSEVWLSLSHVDAINAVQDAIATCS